MRTLPQVSARRRRTDRTMRILLGCCTAIALVPLGLIIFYLLRSGASSWSVHFFTSDPTGNQCFPHLPGGPAPPPCNIGGIRSALLGTLEIMGLATAISVPLGIGVALWLTEYGKSASWFANVVRYFVDVMTGVPSIVFGLFVYIVLVASHVGGDAVAWKGAVALSLLMLPIVTRAAEVVLLLVPSDLREAALALGAPRWRVVLRVVLPTAGSGLVTGALLAIARGAGETAPLLFTIGAGHVLTGSLTQPMNSLPTQIFSDLGEPQNVFIDRAWGSALTLVALILLLNLIARALSRRSRLT
ncbi:MAG: phosphate ABC transporter permease PstA [Actinomycetota bacterium]|nr:phosphate ABC transporter permease PstA [Actinomycetota bacterium]